MEIHVVQQGETLYSIAQKYGVSPNQIIEVNQLENPHRLVVGLALLIPTSTSKHVVQAGETPWKVAQKYGVPLQSLLQANHLTASSKLTPGMVLTIPPKTHTVQSGETIWQIATRYGVSVSTLMDENHIQDPAQVTEGTVLIIPTPKPVIDVNAYTITGGEQGGAQIREVGQYLTYSAYFAYTIKANGDLTGIDDQAVIQASRDSRVAPMMCITNFTSQSAGSDLAHAILTNREAEDRLLANVIRIMRQKGYVGLNVDFENVPQGDREAYNQFLQRTVDKLHSVGYFVSTALAPKISGTQQGLLYEAHDYPAHGRIVDFVVLMTYEWGYRKGPPQAISPINQIKRVLDYAVTVIPRHKIFMGFQIYARDWNIPHQAGQEAETFSQQEAVKRAVQHQATIHYDTATQSPYFRYTDADGRTHEVWFEDARSAQAKFDLVKSYNLRGVSYWTLGYPFPQNWPLLKANFSIRKI
jgi:spore germination protein